MSPPPISAQPLPPIPTVVFLPPAGRSRAEQWLAGARRAAAADLIERIRSSGFDPIYLSAADPGDREFLAAGDVEIVPEPKPPFHFGRALAQVIEAGRFTDLAYFGGAAAPLATGEQLAKWLHQARQLPAGGALVNNLHSTDWAILRDARRAAPLAERLPTDNPLGWVLRQEAGVVVEAAPASAASRTDIDTPADLALMRGHPGLGPHLRAALEPFPETLARRVDELARVLRTPAQSVALIGRVSDGAWREIVQRCQVWVRVYAEERGMRASGRLARGEVRSLIGEWVEAQGAKAFVERLGDLVQGVLWDTRVWMAHRGDWPSTADRMAADLGWLDEITDPALRVLTEAIVESRVPILTGGQGIVAGGLLALLEVLFPQVDPEV